MSASESFSKLSPGKQQELSQQDRTARSCQDGYVLPKSALSHRQTTSSEVITISSDEESDTDDGDSGVDGTLQSSRPRGSPLSVAGDAPGEWEESYHLKNDQHSPRLLVTADDHSIASLPLDEQDPVCTEIRTPAPSSPAAGDSMETPFSQFVSAPQIPGCSDEMAPEPTDSFEAVQESGDELCPSHQPETRGATRPNANDIDGSDDTSTNVQQTRQSSPVPVQPSTRPFDDVAGRSSMQNDKHPNESNEAQVSLGCSRQKCQPVESEAQSLGKTGFHSGAATVHNTEGRTGMLNTCDGSNKRRRRKDRERAGVGSDSDDEFIPTRKLRKASSHRHRQNPTHDRKSKRSVTKPQARNHGKISSASRDQHLDSTIASYEEWLLSDAVLKCIHDNGTMTFQMQFTHTLSPCGMRTGHLPKTTNESPKYTDQPQCHAGKPKDGGLLNMNSLTSDKGGTTHQASPNNSDDPDIYKAELLARWGKNIFFLRWDIDGSTGWEPRRNILDKKMLHSFESTYAGFDEGVDVLSTRESKRGKRQYLLHFHGRPQAEDSWVKEELLSPNLLEKARYCGMDLGRHNTATQDASK
ncbi:chromo (CHRromatin organization MOdifier) domain-containing protein [Metarhizium brunneum]